MWDRRYAEPGLAYGAEPNDFLVEAAQRYLPAHGDVLSLGEGEGRNAIFLARRGLRVTGVDGSKVGLAKAAALARAQGVDLNLVVADLADYALGTAQWDAIVSIWCHLPPAVRGRVHRAVAAALKPGGVFVLEAYTPDQCALNTGGPPTAELMMTLAGVREELAGLTFVVGEEKRRAVHEGPHHQGISAVLQVVARKPG